MYTDPIPNQCVFDGLKYAKFCTLYNCLRIKIALHSRTSQSRPRPIAVICYVHHRRLKLVLYLVGQIVHMYRVCNLWPTSLLLLNRCD